MNRLSICSAFLAAILMASCEPAVAATFTVSPQGKLATLEAARDAARQAGPGPHRIVVMPGEYFLSKTLELTPQDNGLTIESGPAGQVTLYGGAAVTGWRRDGDRFWCADVPGVKEGAWDFRALVVNGHMPERARLPESGAFLHQTAFDVRWLSTVGGGWERKPTQQELNTMAYDPKDIPATLAVKNAEVRVYHMWDESLVGLSGNDVARHVLRFSTPAKSPPGAFGVKKYVVFNTREGMTRPGQWYLDRQAGRVVYWPLADEDMTRAKVVAPRLERIIYVAGDKKREVEKITLRNLSIQATTTPLKSGGFGAYAFDGAVRMSGARQCALEKLEIRNVGGQGVLADRLAGCRIVDCAVHHTGACGIKVDGADTLVARNHIHHVGVYYPSAIALSGGSRAEKGLHLYRNEIHDAPYSGIVCGGENHLIEDNLIYRVMLEMQDGGAIYGGIGKSILRGNMVRDVVKMGEGYGVSAYYLDEGSHDCIVERNVSLGVDRPSHNHIARNNVVRDNVFISDGDMALSFARSAGYTFQGNTLFTPGKVTITQPSAVKVWKDNRVFHGEQGKEGQPRPFAIDDAMPSSPKPERRKYAATALPAVQAPTIDGDLGPDEWPGQNQRLDRNLARDPASGAPAFVRLCYDDRFLYVALTAVMFDKETLSTGSTWRKDDGAEISLAGVLPDGNPVTFVIRGYAGGAVQCATEAGAPADATQRLAKGVRFAAGILKKPGPAGWRGEWAIPWDALGLKPASAMKVAFNLCVFRSQYEEWCCWEGTQSETWRLDQAGTLQCK